MPLSVIFMPSTAFESIMLSVVVPNVVAPERREPKFLKCNVSKKIVERGQKQSYEKLKHSLRIKTVLHFHLKGKIWPRDIRSIDV
jgi:hypothetical protein